MEKKKRNLILGLVLVLLLLVVGVTYAFFTYESGTKSDIVTGQIYMNYEETSTISLTGVFPETKEQALSRNDENGVFEFTITGRNTSKYPVYYEIDLLEGGVITGKTEQSTKILPEHVRIYLERDGEPLVDGMTFKDWNNRRIYVETVPAGTTSNIEHKYTLRMWIDENVTISDTDPNADYTTSEWNDAYTSLKVRVVGDFEYKEVATDASCFTYNVVEVADEIILDTSEEKVEACMTNMMNNWGEDLSTAQDGYQSFCEGIGTIEDPDIGTVALREIAYVLILDGASIEEVAQIFPVVSDITTETGMEITGYDETCGTYIVIPSTIEGLPVISVGEYALAGKSITSVKLPEMLLKIGVGAFAMNYLTEVTIPDGVISIGDQAFFTNNLSTVVLGKNVLLIGQDAFKVGFGYGALNPIEKIINKSGIAFNWKKILDPYGDVTIQDPGVVATGTYVYYLNGNREIKITSE